MRMIVHGCVLLLGMVIPAIASAQIEPDVGLLDEITEATQSQVVQVNYQTAAQSGCVDCPRVGSGWYFGGDLLLVRPTLEADSGGFIDSINGPIFTTFDHSTSIRPYFGYEGCSGTGFRSSFFTIDDDASISGDVGAGTQTLDTQVSAESADLELTQRGSRCGWQLIGSAGLRYANVERASRRFGVDTFGAPIDQTQQYSLNGVGPTISLEARRTFNDRGTTFFVSGRGSWLVGDVSWDNNDLLAATRVQADFDAELPIVELAIGLDQCWNTRFGQCTAGISYETQRWIDAASRIAGEQGGGGPPIFLNQELDFLLSGVGLTLELKR